MHIIIDGYNLIGILHKNIEKAREDLIDNLINYRKIKNHEITVVFDAYNQRYNSEYSSFRGGVRIIYTKLGVTADEVIKRLISEVRREWVVITSDKDVAKYTWSMYSIPVPSDIFSNILDRTTNKAGEIGEAKNEIPYIEDTDNSKPLKGNAYRPSKKQRALSRIIDRL